MFESFSKKISRNHSSIPCKVAATRTFNEEHCRSGERNLVNISSINRIAQFSYDVGNSHIPENLQPAIYNNLFDSFIVMSAGMQTPELRELQRSWPSGFGNHTVVDTNVTADLHTAILLNSVALCVLELDEGNKFARGHPGAHVLPAALAEAERLSASGEEFVRAWFAGYETCTRFAKSFTPRPGLHPHGNWGSIGAAVAVGILNGFNVDELAQSIDAAAGLQLASPFASALHGSFVRNTWIGHANVHGITAARLVQAGLGTVNDTADATLGDLLGSLDHDQLQASLNGEVDVLAGYFKRHASCNYTHPPADAVLQLRSSQTFNLDDIEAIEIETHALALPLNNPTPTTRLAAMFSIPHVVAVALVHGACLPEHFAPDALDDQQVKRLRSIVRISLNPDIDALRPEKRGALVRLITSEGSMTANVPNSIGDADYHPLTRDDLISKAHSLLPPESVQRIQRFTDHLFAAENIGTLMATHLTRKNKQ